MARTSNTEFVSAALKAQKILKSSFSKELDNEVQVLLNFLVVMPRDAGYTSDVLEAFNKIDELFKKITN